MHTLARDGIGLCFDERGAGGTPLVLVPGGSCDHWSFHRQLEHFGATQRCISLDLRGHGRSDKPDQAYTIEGYAEDVAWVIDQLGLDRPVVLGHSMGGAIAVQLAASKPDACRAIVLVDPAPVYDNRAGFQAMLDAFERWGPASVRTRVFRNFFLDGFDEDLFAEIEQHAALTPERVFAAEVASLREWDGATAAAAVGVPTLHIAAAHPACDPVRLVQAIPHAVTGQTVGAGHFNMLEVPDQVNSMIAHFLRQYVGPR